MKMNRPSSENPYSTSAFGNPEPAPISEQHPTFCTVVFVLGIVFACLRSMLVVFSAITVFAMAGQEFPLSSTAPYEVASGAAAALFGFLANGFLLAKKQIGLTFGKLLVLSVIGSIIVGLAQIVLVYSSGLPGVPEDQKNIALGVSVVVGGIVFAIRIGLLVLFVVAMKKFEAWHSQNVARAEPQRFVV